jgi:hypothetical protein
MVWIYPNHVVSILRSDLAVLRNGIRVLVGDGVQVSTRKVAGFSLLTLVACGAQAPKMALVIAHTGHQER